MIERDRLAEIFINATVKGEMWTGTEEEIALEFGVHPKDITLTMRYMHVVRLAYLRADSAINYAAKADRERAAQSPPPPEPPPNREVRVGILGER